MADDRLRLLDTRSYAGINPDELPSGLRERVTGAIATAEILSPGIRFTFKEAPQEQLWNFPPGVTSVFEFTRGDFSASYHIVEGSQYVGSFSSPIVSNTGGTRLEVAHRLGFSKDAEIMSG